jgi:L-seryl-tRNA(Ser) seleniumtransferase
MRIDKIRLAGLMATLIHYLAGEATSKIPVWRMISSPLEEIKRRAGCWAEALGRLADVVGGETMVGGGSLPGDTLPTRLVAISGVVKKGQANMAQALNQFLRTQKIPIIGRISDRVLFLDPRSVLPEDDERVLKALKGAAASLKHPS